MCVSLQTERKKMRDAFNTQVTFSLDEAERKQHSHGSCLCVYSHDSVLQGEKFAEGMPACLDYDPHSFVFMF